LPTPHVVDAPPEFLEANIGYIASWSEVEDRSNSGSRRKEDSKAKKSLFSFCTVVVPWRQHNLPLIDMPDLSGVLPLFSVSLSLLLSFALRPPPLTFSVPPPLSFSLLSSSLFLLSALPDVASLPPGVLPLPLPFILQAPAHTFHYRSQT